MSIVCAFQKWRHYLLGRHFTVYANRMSLSFLVDQRLMGEEQQKWVSKLMGHDCDIKYKPGIENRAADAISRQLQYSALSTVQCLEWDGLKEEVQADERLKWIIQDLLSNEDAHKGYHLKRVLQRKVSLPKDSPRVPMILREFHDSAIGGHSGFFRTYKTIAAIVFGRG